MKYTPDAHHRVSIRLKGYDYSQAGAYFITICTYNRECFLGEIESNGRGAMHCALTEVGNIAYSEWFKTSEIRKNITLDEFVVMPNHIHGIIVIHGQPTGAYGNTPLHFPFQSPKNNLGSIIRGYKSSVTKQINELRKTPLQPVWQRNYYERIIRSEHELNTVREYIIQNPNNWEKDELFM